LFEIIYCEACGDLFVGGQRTPDGLGGASEILTTAPNLEELPERNPETLFENLAHAEFAVFWPSRKPAKAGETREAWAPKFLHTRNSVVRDSSTGAFCSPGSLFQVSGPGARTAGSALPKTCPACGTDYSARRSGTGPTSPLRSFRTGFAKTSQLLATELFS